MPSDPASLLNKLEEVEDAFPASSEDVFEEGLDPTEEERTQLRKACRLLEACRVLRENDGYHTSVVEMSFAAIERTLQFYAMSESNDTVGDFQNHRYAYDRAADRGLLSKKTCDELRQLHEETRSAVYYRDTVATEKQATKIFELAIEVHSYTTEFTGEEHSCVCRQS